MRRLASFVMIAVALSGCGPGVANGGGEGETGDGDGDPGDGDGDPGDGDGDPGDGDGDGDPGDGDGDPGDGDGDSNGPICGAQEIACPDESCQLDLGNPTPCCGHGGECPIGCEPQDASSIVTDCEDPDYAWTGLGCRAVCDCEGPDCADVYSTVGACLEAHEPACGAIGLSTCPFETPLGPTSVSGTNGFGSFTYEFGVFGLVYGEGPTIASIALGRDELALGNFLWALYEGSDHPEVLTISGAGLSPGEHEVYVNVAMPLNEGAMGTLTISEISTEGAGPHEHELWATLAVDEGSWQMSGELAIPGCQRLEMHLP